MLQEHLKRALAVADLRAFAQTAIEMGDAGMAVQALKQARTQKNDEIVQMVLESGLVAKTKTGRAWAVTEKAHKDASDRGFQLLSEGNVSYLQTVEYMCPAGHKFFAKPKSFARSKQPCPNCAKAEVARMQVNVRLPIEHTQKYLELVEYYKRQKAISFLGEELSSSILESNATALGRFLLETAIDDAYMELKDQQIIEEIASWIGFDHYKGLPSIIHDLGTNPWQHKQQNSDEWKRFIKTDNGRIENDYLTLAFSKWGEGLGDMYYGQFFDSALMLAIQNNNTTNTIQVNEDRELERRMKRWKRNS